MSDDDNWEELERLFLEAHELPSNRQQQFVDSACGEDAQLRTRLLQLLGAHRGTGVVDELVSELSKPLSSAFSKPPDVGRRVGPYRIKELLGRGGMGNVFLAERSDGQFEQEVALKVIREGINSESIRSRFMTERQLLARLHHPNIARLLDGGIDDSGRPYFAMEVVQGVRFDTYCDEMKLGIEERLNLFCQVCEAVQYAHQSLVVHRDLKPANILVREIDGSPTVTLMDFGIARLLDSDAPDETTRTATRAMTPEYASPEQIRGESVTTQSDVYSLGVVLYEILSGQRPYDLRELSPAEIEKTVCDLQPAPPSKTLLRSRGLVSRGSKSTRQTSAASVSRGTTDDTLVRQLTGDLDTIVIKALAKEPSRRYQSADAFLEDIKRHLNGMPVVARPDTVRYRLSKFARRHVFGVAASVLFLLLLCGGVTGILWQARTATFERDRAIVEAARSEESLSLLVSVFEHADPGHTDGQTVTAREVLERAAERVQRMEATSGVKPTLLAAIARVFYNIGLSDRADELFREALSVSLEQDDGYETSPQLLQQYGTFKYRVDRWDEADSLLSLAVAGLRASRTASIRDLALALHDRALVLRGLRRVDEAEALALEALDLREADPKTRPADLAATIYLLGSLQHDRGEFAKGETFFREAVAIFRTDSTRPEPIAAEALEALGQYLQFRGDYAESEEFLKEALKTRRRLYGDSHPSVASSEANLGSLYYQIGRTDESEQLLQRVVDYGKTNPGGSADMTVTGAEHALALVWFRQERYAESAELLSVVAEKYRAQFGENFGTLVAVLNHRGRAQLRAGDVLQAAGTFEEVEESAARIFGEGHAYVGNAKRGQASVAVARGQLLEAERLYRLAIDIYSGSLRDDHELIGSAKQDLGSLLLSLQRADEALPLLESSFAILEAKYGSDHQMVLNAGSELALARHAMGNREGSLELAQRSYEGLRTNLGEEHGHTAQALARLKVIRSGR